jgi:hypothetical protein
VLPAEVTFYFRNNSDPRRCYAPKLEPSNKLDRLDSNRNQALPKARVPTEILQSEAEIEVSGVMIKHKDARGNYP